MEFKSYIKLSCISGLNEIVMHELKNYPIFNFSHEGEDSVYLDFNPNLKEVKKMRSIVRAYIVLQSPKLNPLYIANHKSVIGNLIDTVMSEDKSFKSFKLICAGSDTPEIQSIKEYVETTHSLVQQEDADLKIHIIKINDLWEVGVQITPRPLSLRDYRTQNMSGAMDPTIAYAVNSLCQLDKTENYLNAFSGSGTLLIEAALTFPELKKVIGFDNDKEHLSLSVRNIKKAGLIKKIQVKEADILEKPDLGKFDAITADLPFGMLVSKGEDLASLYKNFLDYSEQALNPNGVVCVYTSEFEILEGLIENSKLSIVKTIDLKLMTASNAYLRPRIILLKLK